ncbi:MAG: hypothetical protein IT232_05510 [Flavobacteriales bacterium]|nr:hypothetical protein [Flavobacteriales bacterium]
MKNLQNHIFSETACISKETLLKFINKTLSQQELHTVQKHLIDCEFCSEALEGVEHCKNPEVFIELDHRISKVKDSSSKSTIKIFIAAASVLLVATVGYLSINNFKNVTENQKILAVEQTKSQQPDETPIQQPFETLQKTQEKIIEQVPNFSEGEKITQKNSARTGDIDPSTTIADAEAPDLKIQAVSKTESKEHIATDLQEEFSYASETESYSDSDNLSKSEGVMKETDIEAEEIVSKSPTRTVIQSQPNKTKASKKEYYSSDGDKKEASGVSFYKNAEEKTKLDDERVSPPPAAPVTNSTVEASDISTLLEHGKKLFKQKDYNRAINYLDKVIENKPTTSETHEANWYKALCLIELNKKNEAKKILETLTWINTPFSKQAEEKLIELK